MKRGRNQRRRQGVNPNRALDSNGPDVRIRGTANQIYDKYLALARDASSSGDRIKAENYLQHAEHYFRVIRAMQPSQQPNQTPSSDGDIDQPGLDDGDAESQETRQPRAERNNGERRNGNNAASSDASKNSDADEASAPAPAEASSGEQEEEKKPRRRRAPRRTKKEVAADDAPAEPEAAPAAAAE